MKKFVLMLAAAGLASATAVSFTGDVYGPTQFHDSTSVSAPSGVVTSGTVGPYGGTAVGEGTGGSIGGLCNSTCSNGSPDSLTFTLSSTYTLQILLQDQYNTGDVYQVLLSGGTLGSTQVYQSSVVNLFGTTSQSCYNSTVGGANGGANQASGSCLSATTGTLGPGSYSLTVWDPLLTYIGQQAPYGYTAQNSPTCYSPTGTVPSGSCYQPAAFGLELELTPVVVPEPATFGMLGLGGIALGLLRRRRTSK